MRAKARAASIMWPTLHTDWLQGAPRMPTWRLCVLRAHVVPRSPSIALRWRKGES